MKQVTISNAYLTLMVLDYGATIQKLLVKVADGEYTNVVVGYNHPSRYRLDDNVLGASVGRYAGRISNGGFVIDRARYDVFQEDGVHLHGGKEGFHQKYWTIDEVDQSDKPFVKLSYISKHLEEGYPGNLSVSVTYKLMDNALQIIYEGITDRSTVINLTNHSYFKLDDNPYIDDYELQLNCPYKLETKENLLPTGDIIPVRKTEYDFLLPRKIGVQRLDSIFVKDIGNEKVVEIQSKTSGINMKVYTNQPALVVYTPPDFPGICFEAQNYPDAPNQPDFPKSLLRPGDIYNNISIFKFDIITPS
ncbi:aldose epimerase family protein [Maribacter sp. 1_MG-2023]|uniref:aldose epimerase family protein n=1 Tax=Maribacter sp. 1_MG-2023 TaxID=3062677 RepID=UPI0026E29E53|nr:aldose epimerase family protein [Maribacter sp. 1_MG-2023]MDO6470585.1 aldose epimerase family protein [Maribacter sp. 1_MG-2023]